MPVRDVDVHRQLFQLQAQFRGILEPGVFAFRFRIRVLHQHAAVSVLGVVLEKTPERSQFLPQAREPVACVDRPKHDLFPDVGNQQILLRIIRIQRAFVAARRTACKRQWPARRERLRQRILILLQERAVSSGMRILFHQALFLPVSLLRMQRAARG